jgi:hypothetical protein
MKKQTHGGCKSRDASFPTLSPTTRHASGGKGELFFATFSRQRQPRPTPRSDEDGLRPGRSPRAWTKPKNGQNETLISQCETKRFAGHVVSHCNPYQRRISHFAVLFVFNGLASFSFRRFRGMGLSRPPAPRIRRSARRLDPFVTLPRLSLKWKLNITFLYIGMNRADNPPSGCGVGRRRSLTHLETREAAIHIPSL